MFWCEIYLLATRIDSKAENLNLMWSVEMIADLAIRATTFQDTLNTWTRTLVFENRQNFSDIFEPENFPVMQQNLVENSLRNRKSP